MLALTFWRPWDTALLHLGKPIENREWPPPARVVGERIAIHSGLKWDDEGAAEVARLAAADGVPPDVIAAHLHRARSVKGAIIGTVRIARVLRRDALDPTDSLHDSPWFFGSFGWVCSDLVVLREPVPCRGMHKLWRVPPDVERRILAQ
ncbi:hypothetical protein FGE12_12940 [Aggregicoccus sp. 17bor-14]|uniref:hypothetical protein n=1 Tax=Myxococcaceae TaxID=31 RepID=UPI00129C24B4|nr:MULTISPECIES: hypothetical protein [Myxococcaceae]MBF5043298.1 hypothetical protein [Simulacricoccus sp. 17bor-14]MRI89056.1 hypothetical protein [Aggregicoccus sp. 17bor-14]